MKTLLKLSAILLFCFFNSASATKFAAPQDQEVKSPNGQYLLHIDAKSGLHEMRKGADVLWSFKRDLWHDDYYVSDDGQFVLWVSWDFVQEGDVKNAALKVYSKNGVVLEKTYAELGKPRAYRKDEIGPIGDFWRIWRGAVSRKGEVISIEVEGREKPFEMDLSKLENPRKAE